MCDADVPNGSSYIIEPEESDEYAGMLLCRECFDYIGAFARDEAEAAARDAADEVTQ
jgi:hypothetical protein